MSTEKHTPAQGLRLWDVYQGRDNLLGTVEAVSMFVALDEARKTWGDLVDLRAFPHNPQS